MGWVELLFLQATFVIMVVWATSCKDSWASYDVNMASVTLSSTTYAHACMHLCITDVFSFSKVSIFHTCTHTNISQDLWLQQFNNQHIKCNNMQTTDKYLTEITAKYLPMKPWNDFWKKKKGILLFHKNITNNLFRLYRAAEVFF